MGREFDRVEAGGHEQELTRLVDEVERARESELRHARGRTRRAAILGELKGEILRRFAELHPGVEVRFLSGPYCEEDVPKGPARRRR